VDSRAARAQPGGVCTSTGIYFTPETPIPLFEMYLSDVTFKTGRPHARTIIPEVLNLVQSGRLQPERVTSETATFGDAIDALLDFTTKLVIMSIYPVSLGAVSTIA
jgi:threonine dehydrogenase-like Zn-dependent dehydrogenase